jgi:hypothetical protein
MALLAVLGAVLGVGAAIAGILGVADAAVLFVTLAALALVGAFVGLILRTTTRVPHERRPAFTGETAWLRAMLREHPKPLPRDDEQRRRSSDTP